VGCCECGGESSGSGAVEFSLLVFPNGCLEPACGRDK
jgi:hypothetical protein